MTTPDGLLIVDKPAGWTSHDVVARCRRLCGTRRVGHAGTLDPMATGVLVLGINRATKLLTFLVGCDKTYTATIRLGQSTMTDDAEGEITSSHDVSGLTAEAIARAVAALTGEISQVPSSVSAIKVDGQRSYARVRAGQDVVLPARPVTVGRFDILGQRDQDACPGRKHTGSWTSTSSWTSRRGPTSGRWPATSATPWAWAGTSPRCGAPASGGSRSTTRTRSTDLEIASEADAIPVVTLLSRSAGQLCRARADRSGGDRCRLRAAHPIPAGGAQPARCRLRTRGTPGGHARRERLARQGPRRLHPVGFVECPSCCDGPTSPRSPRATARAW